MTNQKKSPSALKVGSNVFFGGVFVIVATAFGLYSMSQFVDVMTLLPLVLGGALLVVALIVGAVRGEYRGFVPVVGYAILAGFMMSISPNDGGSLAAVLAQRMVAVLPWCFVGICGLAIALNAMAMR